MKAKDQIVNLAIVASDSGTYANVVMAAWRVGMLPGVNIKVLISTRIDAGCLNKAAKHDVSAITVDRSSLGKARFEDALRDALKSYYVDMVFLLGCEVYFPFYNDYPTYNIYPADVVMFGGKGMYGYGLEVHKKVLIAVKDNIGNVKSIDEEYFTHPTVHRVNEEYDSGPILTSCAVNIPEKLLYSLISGGDIDTLAEELQRVVLPEERKMLPDAVEMAVEKYWE